MKAIIYSTLTLGLILSIILILDINQQPAPSATPPLFVNAPPAASRPPIQIAPKHTESMPVTQPAPQPAPVVATAPAEADPDDPAAQFARDMAALVSTETSFSDRQALLTKLKSSGQLDQAIAELQQRAAANTNDAELLVALGEATLKKFPVAEYDQAGILALQVDQAFNSALKMDPGNWEAEFFKADSLSYWPSEMNKGPEVIQQLSNLIDQQQTMTPQPQFAQTYVILGDEYQKTGQPDYAAATWKLGLASFPTDPTLQQRTARQ